MKGFILYQTYEIVEGKPSIMLFGKLENSQSFLTINSYRPYFYIKESDKAALPKEFDYEKSNFKNFNKKLLIKVYTEIPSEIPTLRKYLEDKGVECYEADIKFTQRFLIDNKIKVSVLGKWYDLQQNVVSAIRKIGEETKDYDSFFVNFCVNYDGQDEILDAFKLIGRQIKAGKMDPDLLKKDMIKRAERFLK